MSCQDGATASLVLTITLGSEFRESGTQHGDTIALYDEYDVLPPAHRAPKMFTGDTLSDIFNEAILLGVAFMYSSTLKI